MATLDDEATALIQAVKDNAAETATQTAAIKDLGSRVDADFATLKGQIAAGTPPDPALLTKIADTITTLNATTAAAHENTTALAGIDPASPTPPPAPVPVAATPAAPADTTAAPTPADTTPPASPADASPATPPPATGETGTPAPPATP